MQKPHSSQSDTRPSVGVIVPAYNAEATLAGCLEAIASMTMTVNEFVVVDDGSTDCTGIIANASAARVLFVEGGPKGPAYARNIGMSAIQSDYGLFVDADVIVHPDALALLLDDLTNNGAAAAFGSYDDRPTSQRATSVYANLRHHYVHQHGQRDGTTFWSGLGLIDRQVFETAGGFDQNRFRKPSIEDVELGARLIRAGHKIRLVPEAQGKHCKDWRASNVWWTDIVARGYPWSRLIAEGAMSANGLSLSKFDRFRSLLAISIFFGLVLSLILPIPIKICFILGILYFAANAHILFYVSRRTTIFNLVVFALMNFLYHIYAVVTFVSIYCIVKMQSLVFSFKHANLSHNKPS